MKIIFLVFLMLCVVCAAGARAQTLRASVISGGATSSSESGMKLRATLGQPVIGATAAALRAGQGFWYAVTAASGTNAVEPPRRAPSSFTIGAVAPSPLAGAAEIPFTFRERGTLVLRCYDAAGRLVAERDAGEFQPGSARVSFDAAPLRSGSYHLLAQFHGEQQSVSLVVVK